MPPSPQCWNSRKTALGLVFEVPGDGTQSLMSVRQAPNPRSYSLSTLPPNLKCVQNRLVGRMNTCPHYHGGDLNDANNDDRSKADGGGDSEGEAVRVVAMSLNIWIGHWSL